MGSPEFVLQRLEEIDGSCRTCDNLLSFIDRRIMELDDNGVTETQVISDIDEVIFDCNMLRVLHAGMDKVRYEMPERERITQGYEIDGCHMQEKDKVR